MRPSVSQIPALTGVRILAAAWVVVVHFRFEMYGLFPETQAWSTLVEGGYLGVELFFILSGFIISHNYASRFQTFSWPTYRRFIQKRIARLYPVHVVTLLALAGMLLIAGILGVTLNAEGKHDPVNFLMNLTLLQAIPPAFAWNGPAWSISAEAGAYVFFPVVAFLVMRTKSKAALLSLTCCALAFTIAGLLVVESMGDYSATSYQSIWLRICGEFTAGCFLWKFWHAFTTPGRKYDLVAAVGLIGSAAMLFLEAGTSASDFLALPFIALFVLGCAGSTGVVRRVLSHPAFEYGGRISFSLYMVHVVVQMVGRKFLPWASFEDSSWLIKAGVLAAYFVAAFAGAALLYHFIEKPGQIMIQNLGQRKAPAPVMVPGRASDLR